VVDGEGLAHIRSYLYRAPRPKSVADAIAIQRAAHGPAFSALSDADWARFVSAIYREHRGRPVPDFDPKVLKQVRNFNVGTPIADSWPQFLCLKHVPLLAIRGANSKLLSARTLAEMAKRHPDCATVTVEGQGHAPLLETGELPRTIAAFLQRADARETA
jgi:pimeloyl-ACP methyl ester carboxylesterase